MKKYILAILMLVGFSAFAQKADTLTIVSYNIHHANPPVICHFIKKLSNKEKNNKNF